ncbi:MAG TPA: formate dehydrogenase accessory protein FdhE [Vicinamibacterales bacterium]|nr:formate dehydrogenase accessory protein FdhE [Vicinamibacterales bacterium]
MPPPPRDRSARAEPQEIQALAELKADHPELAAAVDLQIELLRLQRRVRSRIPLPSLRIDGERLAALEQSGRPLLRFEEIPLNWSDLRFLLRETTAALRRHESLDEADWRRVETLARQADALEPLVAAWFAAAADRRPAAEPPDADIERLDHLLTLAMRPFLTRCAEAALAQADFRRWLRPYCPVCGGEPEFAAITPGAERLLLCGRCTASWLFAPLTCPFCGNADRARITSFASRDGCYRIYACDACRRYLKAHDGRRARRPLMLPVDSIATLPLDAAAMQRGYHA